MKLLAGCALILVVSLGGCTSNDRTIPVAKATGEPRVDLEVVLEHAGSLEESVPERAAGSQQEQAASTYLLGHLQTAGYIVRLDPVPVENLVESTNVMTRFEGPVDFLVVTPYDTQPGAPSTGTAVGLFLELARATNVAAPEMSVGFVALGAEFHRRNGAGDADGDRIGSRRLAQVLLDEDQEPSVIYLHEIDDQGPFGAAGSLEDELMDFAQSRGIEAAATIPAPPTPDVFAQAGFPSTSVSGGVEEVAAVLLGFLIQAR